MKESPVMNETKRILKGAWKQITYKTLISIVVRGLALIIPILWSGVINDISKAEYSVGYKFIFVTLLLTVIYYVSEMINQFSYYKLHRKLYTDYTALAATATQDNSIYSLSRFSLGEYTNILNYDIEIISTYFSNIIIRIVKLFEFVVIYWYFFGLDIYIFLITVVVSVVMLGLLILSGKKTQEYNTKRKQDLDKKTSIVHETFNGIKEIKGFNIFNSTYERIITSAKSYLTSNSRYSVYFINVKLGVQAIIEVVRYILVFYGVYLVSKGSMELGTVLIIYTYYGKIIENYDIIAYINAEYKDLTVSLTRFNKILEYKSTNKNKKYLPDRDYQGKIAFEGVLYGNKEDPILNDVSFEIPANSLTVVTGKAGSGKTGIFDLLLKMNRQHDGIITIDDDDISKISKDTYYNLISIVRKDPVFFDLSIKDNFLLIDDNFDRAVRICKLLGVDEMINDLPNGYDTLINGTGFNMSAMVKQLVAIVRVLLKDSKIMLFDETLSILDGRVQDKVLTLFTELKKEHTIVLISREEHIFQYADRIIYMNDNKVQKIKNNKVKK